MPVISATPPIFSALDLAPATAGGEGGEAFAPLLAGLVAPTAPTMPSSSFVMGPNASEVGFVPGGPPAPVPAAPGTDLPSTGTIVQSADTSPLVVTSTASPLPLDVPDQHAGSRRIAGMPSADLTLHDAGTPSSTKSRLLAVPDGARPSRFRPAPDGDGDGDGDGEQEVAAPPEHETPTDEASIALPCRQDSPSLPALPLPHVPAPIALPHRITEAASADQVATPPQRSLGPPGAVLDGAGPSRFRAAPSGRGEQEAIVPTRSDTPVGQDLIVPPLPSGEPSADAPSPVVTSTPPPGALERAADQPRTSPTASGSPSPSPSGSDGSMPTDRPSPVDPAPMALAQHTPRPATGAFRPERPVSGAPTTTSPKRMDVPSPLPRDAEMAPAPVAAHLPAGIARSSAAPLTGADATAIKPIVVPAQVATAAPSNTAIRDRSPTPEQSSATREAGVTAASVPPAAIAPAILPALQAFGAALHRAAVAERKPAIRVEDTAIMSAPVTGLAATTLAQPAPVDTTRPHWPETMIARIDDLRDAANAPGSAADTRIRLHPDALGAVDVALRRESDEVHVHFTAAEPATARLLADAQPRLTELAEARGLRLTQAGVDGNGQGDRRQPAPHAQPQLARTPRPASSTPADDPAAGEDRLA